MLRHRTLRSSRVVKEVSGFRSSSGGEFWLSQDDRQGGQASHPVVRRYLVFHWSQCRGIRTYLELRANSASFFLRGSTRDSIADTGLLFGLREVGIPLELKQGMGAHLQMRWDTWCSSRVVVGNLAFILSFDGDLWVPLS